MKPKAWSPKIWIHSSSTLSTIVSLLFTGFSQFSEKNRNQLKRVFFWEKIKTCFSQKCVEAKKFAFPFPPSAAFSPRGKILQNILTSWGDNNGTPPPPASSFVEKYVTVVLWQQYLVGASRLEELLGNWSWVQTHPAYARSFNMGTCLCQVWSLFVIRSFKRYIAQHTFSSV